MAVVVVNTKRQWTWDSWGAAWRESFRDPDSEVIIEVRLVSDSWCSVAGRLAELVGHSIRVGDLYLSSDDFHTLLASDPAILPTEVDLPD